MAKGGGRGSKFYGGLSVRQAACSLVSTLRTVLACHARPPCAIRVVALD